MYSHAIFDEAKLVESRQKHKQVNKEYYKKMEEIFKVEFIHQEINLEDIEKFQMNLQKLPRKRES